MDIVEEEFHKYEPRLTETLERPDEIWEHKGLLQGKDVSVLLKSSTGKALSPSRMFSTTSRCVT